MNKLICNKAKAIAVLSDVVMDNMDNGFLYFQEVSEILNPSNMKLSINISADNFDEKYELCDAILQVILDYFSTIGVHCYILADIISIDNMNDITLIASKYDRTNDYQFEIYTEYMQEANILLDQPNCEDIPLFE